MSHVHLSRELLHAVAEERVPRGIATDLMIEHLLGRCPTCAGEIARWGAWKAVRDTPDGASGVVTALRGLLDRLPGELAAGEAALRRARRDVARLGKLPPEERRPAAERAQTRCRGDAFAARCLAEARACLPGQPREALGWAEAAVFGATWAGPQPEPYVPPATRALQARAHAHRGNALRILERLDDAEDDFERALALLRHGGVTDLAAHAEVATLEASLHRDRRHFAAAEGALHVAALLHTVRTDRPELARARLMQGTVYHAWGRPEAALEAAEAAEAALEENGSPPPRLRLAVRHNRADYLCELGRFADAREVLEASRDLYDRFDDAWTRLRLAWLEGKLAAGLGRDGEAEARFRAARDGFLAEGSAYDAALVSLELAALYLHQGRCAEVRELAEAMVATFRRLGVHREAVEAAQLFARAAAREALTAGFLARLAHYLRQARSGPGLAFQP
jgi:hypothetical protein